LSDTTIKTAEEIVVYCKELHSEPEDWLEGDIAQRILAHKNYRLTVRRLDQIESGRWALDPVLGQEFLARRQRGEAFPAIVCTARGRVIDGEHRCWAARAVGDLEIAVWVASDRRN
jgi:hypothetical protein